MDLQTDILEDRERGARRLVAECGDRLYAAALVLCHDAAAAEDLVFRTLARAVDRIGQFSGKTSFWNWLYAILMNLHRSDARKFKADVFATGAVPDDAEPAWPAPGDPIGADEAAAVRDAVRALPPVFRQTVVLRYFEDKSLAEMAEVMAVPLSTVKSRLRLAQGRLNARLAGVFGKQKGAQTR